MIESHKEKIEKEVEIIDCVVCNKCGKKLDSCTSEYITLDPEFGYFSEIFGDGDKHESHICEWCYLDFIRTFKVQTNGFDINRYPF